MTDVSATVKTREQHMCRLRCPLCERANGFWKVNFRALYESEGSVSRRKRCKRCQVRLVYKAYYNEESKKVVVVCLMDDKAKKDVAKMFQVDLEDVDAAIASVNEDKEEQDAFAAEVAND